MQTVTNQAKSSKLHNLQSKQLVDKKISEF